MRRAAAVKCRAAGSAVKPQVDACRDHITNAKYPDVAILGSQHSPTLALRGLQNRVGCEIVGICHHPGDVFCRKLVEPSFRKPGEISLAANFAAPSP
jgi:hypothetical protein